MSTAGLINRYVWFVTTIYNRGPISLEEIQHRFESHFGRGEELSERQFHRYTDAVEELFDIEIKYSRTHRGYVIADREGIDNMAMRKWLLQTFSVNTLLGETPELKKRVLLENVPSGQQYLTPIFEAMRENRVLTMTYHSFGRSEATTFDVEPWCVKLFDQRWYMLGKSDKMRIHSLDRIKVLEPTERKFKLPKEFDATKFFEDYYGIIIGDEDFEVEPVALKVDWWQSKYLRTLPLHHSQVEVERNEEYSIFEYRLCPSFDFRQKILSMGDSVEVLAPYDLVLFMRDEVNRSAKVYSPSELPKVYKFKVY
ncbi:MAG: WYL domain-containing protein [Alistipes sp.]|nr:WYL domain-containing protein [Alistipes sp.]MBR3893072.1 WYL domain-containing protein [Alistipes sp.]